ncbi:hypothetical protein HAZT_HAZT006873 [Hyalella azteca]|uniref:Kinesin motor domain-containing protein n=1 Tax=Hyalella azteca TaxID=294128 RepID=A0A6A0GSZ0_HYAAZ|nr:hypothetical protein HAZT_HAZT006873 [Hyalella azteca]
MTIAQKIFEEVGLVVQSALDGFNVCVLAYGATWSGKTCSMEGSGEDAGIIPRTVDVIYDIISPIWYSRSAQLVQSALDGYNGWEYKMEVSILEIYNEDLRDLLASPSGVKNLTYEIKLTDARSAHTHVTNLRKRHMPSRASKLTQLLVAALGGKSTTLMMAGRVRLRDDQHPPICAYGEQVPHQ